MYIYESTYIHINIYIDEEVVNLHECHAISVYIYVCDVYICCIYIYIHICTFIYVYIRIYLYTYKYIYRSGSR